MGEELLHTYQGYSFGSRRKAPVKIVSVPLLIDTQIILLEVLNRLNILSWEGYTLAVLEYFERETKPTE